MKARLVALFLALLLLPLGLALWLGVRSMQDSQVSALTQARTVWAGPLADLRSQVATFVQSVEETLRSGVETPLAKTVFTAQDGVAVVPPRYRPDGTRDPFFDRTAALWDQKLWDRPSVEGGSVPTAGWQTWATTEPVFVFWYRDAREPGVVHGVELDTWAFLSRLSAQLPELRWTKDEGATRALLLRDRSGSTFHRWGRWEPGDTSALIALPLAPPFEGWELRLYLAPQALGDAGLQWAVVFVLVALGLAGVVGLGAWFLVRTLGASLQEAGQRVKFVNQVSHELKTPLTNILLYTELLEKNLGEGAPPRTREYLEVIRGEGGRLGRLITNVLTFARDKPDAPRPRTALWNEVVDAALKPFRPGWADRGLELSRTAGAEVEGEWDPDWVGQIVGNLVSNAEKYAAQGGVVEVTTGSDERTVWLRVADRGPGIPAAASERIFVPFARLDDKLTSGAAGTGLGLGIARELARRHQGELILERTTVGASFLLTLPRVFGGPA